MTQVDAVGFEQAPIGVENEREFEELKHAVNRVLSPETVERFLQRLDGRNVRVRDWDGVLTKRLLEKTDETLERSGNSAQDLYRSLSVSDQAQMREFYLFRVEEVDPKLRTKFHKVYQYY